MGVGIINYLSYWSIKNKKTELAKIVNISPNTLTKLSKDEYVSRDVLVKICEFLQSDIGDIVEVV